MSDINVRSDSVDVEQIMRQIRARISEKRGVDYTEAELQQLATVKLEKFLDPRGLRSDLVDQFRRHRAVSPEPPKYEFEDTTLYETHRGVLRTIRRMLNPILKLFINPNPLIHALHVQKQVNDEFHKRFRKREEMDPLFYEVIHNLVVEVTRLGIEVQNVKMRVESLSSRLDFDERRARSLEGVVQYRPGAVNGPSRPSPSPGTHGGSAAAPAISSAPQQAPAAQSGAQHAEGGRPPGQQTSATPQPHQAGPPGQGGQAGEPGRRRRRRRRRRRPGQTLAETGGAAAAGVAGAGAVFGRPDAGGPAETASAGRDSGDADTFDAGDDDGGPDDSGEGPDEGAPDQ